MTRKLSYNMLENELVPEPGTLRKLEDNDLPTIREMLKELLERTDPRIFPTEARETQQRIWDMALALYEVVINMDIFAQYDRVTVHRICLDTAMVWEFG